MDPNAVPWRAIGRVQTELGGRCTGFLIGPRSVVTAAHCLFLRRPRHYIQPGSVHFVTSYAYGTFAGHSVAVRLSVAPGYDPMNEGRTAGADWALLTLAAPLGAGGRTLALAGADVAKAPIALGGYSRDRAEVLDADLDCAISGRGADAEGRPLVLHTCSATGGTSGAPLLARSAGGTWDVVGMEIAAAADRGGIAVPASAIRVGLATAEPEAARAQAASSRASSSAAAGADRSR